MNHSPAYLHALELAERVTVAIWSLPCCLKGHVPCWRVKLIADGEVAGNRVNVAEGPYEHLTLPQALDVAAVALAHHSSALELIAAARSDASRQLSLDVS